MFGGRTKADGKVFGYSVFFGSRRCVMVLAIVGQGEWP